MALLMYYGLRKRLRSVWRRYPNVNNQHGLVVSPASLVLSPIAQLGRSRTHYIPVFNKLIPRQSAVPRGRISRPDQVSSGARAPLACANLALFFSFEREQARAVGPVRQWLPFTRTAKFQPLTPEECPEGLAANAACGPGAWSLGQGGAMQEGCGCRR